MRFALISPPAFDIAYDPVYATTQNFVGRVFYRTPHCLLHPDAASCLQKAIGIAAAAGYRFHIFDAYRPLEVQRDFWDFLPDENYIANPATTGSTHNRGIAIDLTLADRATGQSLEMGTGFDDMTPASGHNADEATIGGVALRNRKILRGIMEQGGFMSLTSEWWHYNLPNPQAYPIVADGEAGPALL